MNQERIAAIRAAVELMELKALIDFRIKILSDPNFTDQQACELDDLLAELTEEKKNV